MGVRAHRIRAGIRSRSPVAVLDVRQLAEVRRRAAYCTLHYRYNVPRALLAGLSLAQLEALLRQCNLDAGRVA
jgi:hypothetical protein